MREKEDTIEEKIEAMNEALEHLRTESANLLLMFKKQVSFERTQSANVSEAEKTQKHLECYKEILSEWAVIKALYSLLVSNVQSVSDIKVDEKTKPIEVILNKLASPLSPFYSHEFQFPFNLSVLLSGIRSVVKNFIKYTSPNFVLSGSVDGSLNNIAEIATGPINTNNVKNAAKRFEEITEKVAESAIRLKRNAPAAPAKSSGKVDVPSGKSKGEALFAKRAQQTGSKLPVSAKYVDQELEAEPESEPPRNVEAPVIISSAYEQTPVKKQQNPQGLSLAIKDARNDEGDESELEILKPRTPIRNDELDNPFRSNSPSPSSVLGTQNQKARKNIEAEESIPSPTTKQYVSVIADEENERMISMMIDADVVIDNASDYSEENDVVVKNPVQVDVIAPAVLPPAEIQKGSHAPADSEEELQELGQKQDSDDVAEMFQYSQEFKVDDYEDDDLPPLPPSGFSEGRSSILTIIKGPTLTKPNTNVQKEIKNVPSVSVPQPVNIVANNSTLPPDAADFASPLSRMLADESLAVSRLAVRPAAVSDVATGPRSATPISPSTTDVASPTVNKKTLSISTKIGDAAALDSLSSPGGSGPPPLPTSPKPVKMTNAIPAARQIQKPAPPKEEIVVPPVELSKPKRERPKTLLQELKELTDNVAKRRQDITSVMFNDRDYIVGIMDAFDEVDEKNVDVNTSPLDVSEKSFHPDIDAVFSDLDKTVRPDHMREISGPLIMKENAKPSSPKSSDARKPVRKPGQLDVNGNNSNDNKSDKPKSPIEGNSNILIPYVHESDAELKQKLLVSKAIQSLPKPSLNEQPAVPYDPLVSIPGESKEVIKRTISLQTLNPWMEPQKFTQVLMVPLNAMFDIHALDMSETHRFGRNNTTNHPFFKGFPTLVVSRNHADFWEKRKKIYMRDIGSSSGTFRNQVRLSPPNQKSAEVEIFTGDYIQLGKDFQDDSPLDQYGRIAARKRCVKFQIIIIPPGQTALDCIKDQSIPIESPVNRSLESSSAPNEGGGEGEVNAPQTQTHHGIKPILPASDKPSAKAKIITPPPPPLPDKEKQASKQISASTERYNNNPEVGLESRSNHSFAGGSKIRLGENLDNLDDFGFPIKEGFRHKALNDQYVISYTVTNGKVAKLQVNNAANGQLVIDTNLMRWDDKSRITITDYRLVAQRTFDIFLETKPGAKSPGKLKSFSENLPWQVANNSGLSIGHLVFVNDIKMEILSVEKAQDGAQISITGDFKQKRLMFIKKWPSSREQSRFGECQGKYQTKKSFKDSMWVANVEVESGSNSRLLLCGIILTCCLNP